MILGLPTREQRSWMRLLPPDDAADVVQEAPTENRDALLALLDEPTRREVLALLAYAEDDAGGLMNPRFARLRPDATVDEAIRYLRKQMTEQPRTIYYAYVLDAEQRLLGVVSFRQLFTAPPHERIRDIMRENPIVIPENMDQEAVSHIFAQKHMVALPVVDAEGHMKGIVTVDDVVDVVQEEATEDMQKLGGVAALDAPYLQIGAAADDPEARRLAVGAVPGRDADRQRDGLLREGDRARGRAGAVHPAHHLERRQLRLAGDHAGHPRHGARRGAAARLVARHPARVPGRHRPRRACWRSSASCASSPGSGCSTPTASTTWAWRPPSPSSLVGVVLWGTMAGSMLPFILRRLGFDPASASAPFVATLVDVSGLVIYFTMAAMILRGTLL